MRGLKYRYKYLLYESPSTRFTRKAAEELSRDRVEQGLLFKNLATRSLGYRKKVERNLRKHPELLLGLIERLAALPEPTKHSSRKRYPGKRGKPKTERTQYTGIRIFQGGAPGLGKRG